LQEIISGDSSFPAEIVERRVKEQRNNSGSAVQPPDITRGVVDRLTESCEFENTIEPKLVIATIAYIWNLSTSCCGAESILFETPCRL
jgi:hypothetical protein